MKDWWIKFGCFLTGYSYKVLQNCTEVSRKTVKKFTASMVIVIMSWGFIGFSFSERYLKADLFGSIVGASVSILLIVMIERQITLTVGKNKGGSLARVLLGVSMALIGAAIVDQILFKEDIEKHKNEVKIEQTSAQKSSNQARWEKEIEEFEVKITEEKKKKDNLIKDFNKKPLIKSTDRKIVTKHAKYIKDGLERDTVYKDYEYTTIQINNPISQHIESSSKIISNYENKIQNLKEKVSTEITKTEEEVMSNVGFIHEIEIMYEIITKSWLTIAVWALWFFFFLLLELLVLISHWTKGEDDYDIVLQHQLKIKRLELDRISESILQNKTSSKKEY